MRSIEFEAIVTNGTIEIPHEYRQMFGKTVRVKLTTDEIAGTPQSTILDKWLASPIRMAEFHPMSRADVYER